MLKVLRRGRPLAVVSVVFLTILACLYYTSYTNNVVPPTPRGPALLKGPPPPPQRAAPGAAPPAADAPSTTYCPDVRPANADVDTVQQFGKFDFQPYWMKSKEYWDAHFEERYKQRKEKWDKLPLKVILVPHSHNDPGWLKTYEGYYHYHSRNILNNMADKLKTLSNMTFIWSEISYFSQWWESAHPTKRNTVRKLLEDKRLEITTGGWVMTDEATSHLYAMLDQLIEGHQWVKNNLGISPATGWAIDPFGHGSTVPYLLKASGVDQGAVIQRIHYAWKQWLAEKQMGDFHWRQNWDSDGHTDLLTHNQPFDIYSIKHSCGPHPQVCLNFDFRKIPGEYTEYSIKSVPIDDSNVRAKAELLLNQYGRTGSLFPHNVVLMPLGDDFRYEHELEWEQQYHNYKRLFDYVNKNKDRYQAELVFGTPSDYFREVRARMEEFKSLQGDFYVYSDIFSEGRPAYWSGYYTTRPYWKILDRELEANVRSAEILYTWALNRARQLGSNSTVKLLERDYEKLTRARRHLGVFQHHDAITGTSKFFVMHDYALKLFESLQDAVQIQGFSAQTLLRKDNLQEKVQDPRYLNDLPTSSWLLPDAERESYERLPRKIPITVLRNSPRTLVVFNSLAQPRQDVMTVHVSTPHVQVLDSTGAAVPIQINPVWNLTSTVDKPQGKEKNMEHELRMVPDVYELMFLVDIPAVTLATFTLRYHEGSAEARAVVYCSDCGTGAPSSPFEMKKIQPGDVQLENYRMKLLIDGRTGFLKAITRKATGVVTQCALQFAAYPSAQFHSGAYLFMPDPHSRDPEHEVLDEDSQQIVITSGPLASQLDVVYNKMLHHFVRIYHAVGALGDAVYIENTVDFEAPPKNRETELFMRVVSDISNGDPPEFYSDLNGFQMQRRVKVERIGIEGNYYPLTTQAFIQDGRRRLSLLVAHAQGAAAWQPGWLEVMLDRRTLYDDSRGMGEGVVDNKKTLMRYWLLLEEQSSNDVETDVFPRPSLFAQHLSNELIYPANVFVSEKPVPPTGLSLFDKPFPCDLHLMNLRTLSDLAQFPSRSALLVAHRQGFACGFGFALRECGAAPATSGALLHPRTRFSDLRVSGLDHVTLTGLRRLKRLESFDDAELEPMGLMTINVTFSS